MREEKILEGMETLKDIFEYSIKTGQSIHILNASNFIKAIEGILNLYNKEKGKNKVINILKKDMPENTEIVCMYKGDFERNYNSEYISKDKIRELLQEYDKDIAWANADDHYYFTKFIKELLEGESNE